jgi:hypothetical protein
MVVGAKWIIDLW